MLNDAQITTVSKSMTSQSVISSTDANGGVTSTAAANMRADFNSQGAVLTIQFNAADFATLTASANNATTQADALDFCKQALAACGDAGMTYYGAPSSATASTTTAK